MCRVNTYGSNTHVTYSKTIAQVCHDRELRSTELHELSLCDVLGKELFTIFTPSHCILDPSPEVASTPSDKVHAL